MVCVTVTVFSSVHTWRHQCFLYSFLALKIHHLIGDSNNLSHSSLTSSSNLTALHLLPQTNATLYAEFTGANSSPDAHINAETDKSSSNEESPFITEDALSWDDGCDVPLDVVKSVVTTSTVDDGQFALNGSSTIVWNGTAEVLKDVDGEGNDPADDDIDDEPVPVTLSCGHRAKIGSKKYGVE